MTVSFDWSYDRSRPDWQRLYAAAKASQWDGATQLDWPLPFDPHHPERVLIPEECLAIATLDAYRQLDAKQKREHQRAYMAWVLSQFLHGEQGALFAAAQVTQEVPWLDAKLYGATQVMDEARHVEVFHRYLTTKLERLYRIDGNLHAVITSLMEDARLDIRFLGMQIMIEGMALGAFSLYRSVTREPLLKELLKYVITDEARHVHFGVVALRELYQSLSDTERREREAWAFETLRLLQRRFLMHEFYDEFYAHMMSRAQWDAWLLRTPAMDAFTRTLLGQIVPNLQRIGLVPERMWAAYGELAGNFNT